MSEPGKGTVVVTGGSGGIGAAIRDDFLHAGRSVINLDIAPCPRHDERLTHHDLDLSDISAVQACAADIAAHRHVDTLVHNAGVLRPGVLGEVRHEDYAFLSRLHVESLIALAQAFLPKMKQAGFGRIITISSRAVLGLQTRTSYSATKAAQVGMMRTWALELGPSGITVNAIAPGPVITDQFRSAVPEGDPREQKIADSVPVKRIGRPEDISRVVSFLAEPASSFITGQTWFVCGGASLGSLSL